MASPIDLYADWNGDLILAQDGDVSRAVGWDAVRQRIIRRMVTNSAQTLSTGVQTAADYYFHPKFGFGMGSMVDGDFTPDFIEQLKSQISQAVFADDAVDTTIPPSIKFTQPTTDALWIVIGVTLVTGQVGQISVQLNG